MGKREEGRWGKGKKDYWEGKNDYGEKGKMTMEKGKKEEGENGRGSQPDGSGRLCRFYSRLY